jgi:hypothetical protein
MLKISSLVALLLKATDKQSATECPGRESKHRMEGKVDEDERLFL